MTGQHKTVFKLIKPQADFILSRVRYPAFVGAWGTGKTAMGISKIMSLSKTYPNNLGFIFRKEFVDLRDSTMVDFELYTGLKINSKREVDLPNGSSIKFRHLEELHNIQNVNLGWFMIEQAEELDTDDPFFTLFGRLRRKGCLQQGIIIANTNGRNWIYKNWKLNTLKGGELFEAKTEDNASNLSKEFTDSLEVLRSKKPGLYKRFVENSWEESGDTDVMISSAVVNKALKRELSPSMPIRRIVSIDVARYGDDKTVMYALEQGARKETVTLGRVVYEKKSTMESVGLAVIFAKKHKVDAFAVDEIGVGGGVADRLQELGYSIVFVNASKKSIDSKVYFNTRAEIYQTGADLFEEDKISLNKEDEDLREELSWSRYKAIKSSGIFQVEAKDDIKKRMGRSPDHADAYLNGLWAVSQTQPITERKDVYARSGSTEELDPMAI